MSRRSGAWRGREALLAIAIVLAAVVFGLSERLFLGPANLLNIGVQSSMVLLVGFGMTVVIVAGGIDLSVGSVAAMVGMTAVWLIAEAALPAPAAIAAALAGACLVGAVNGLVVTVLGVPGIIATLGMMTALRGTAYLIGGGSSIRSTDPQLAWIAQGDVAGVPVPLLAVAVAFAAIHALLGHTALGRAFYACGGNLAAARSAGIPVGRVIVSSYVLSSLLAATAGLIAASRTAAGSPLAGTGWELQAVAIVILGGASLFGGTGRLAGTLLAGLFLAMISNGISLLGITSWVEGVLVGALLIVVVALDSRRAAVRRSGGRRGVALARPAAGRA